VSFLLDQQARIFMSQPSKPVCLHCGRTSDELPLIAVRYRDQDLWICPQHLPVLIHKPAELAGKLPGAEKWQPGEH
jgi:hypothetical protein